MKEGLMRAIPVVFLTLVLLIALSFLLFQPKASDDILGKWEAVEAPEGLPHGLNIVLEFGRGGLFTYSFATASDGTYELDGDYFIITTSKASGENETEIHEIKTEGDELIYIASEGKEDEIRLTRLSSPALDTPPIVGRWGAKGPFFLHMEEDALLVVKFDQDGQYAFRLQTPPQPEEGRYEVEGNLLTIILDGVHSNTRFRQEQGFLILEWGSDVGRYKRAEW
jgi:hypothetical protein